MFCRYVGGEVGRAGYLHLCNHYGRRVSASLPSMRQGMGILLADLRTRSILA